MRGAVVTGPGEWTIRARLAATGSVDRRASGLRLDVPACRFLLPAQLELQVDVVVARRH